MQLQRLGSETQQVKVGRGEGAEAYGEGRRARRGSRYARQGAVLCKEANEAAISRVERRRSRVPRIDAGERESVGNVDRGRAPRHERATDTARVAIRGMFRRRQRGLSHARTRRVAQEHDPPLYTYTARNAPATKSSGWPTSSARSFRDSESRKSPRRDTRKSPVVAGEQRCGETCRTLTQHGADKASKNHPMIPHTNSPDTRTTSPRQANKLPQTSDVKAPNGTDSMHWVRRIACTQWNDFKVLGANVRFHWVHLLTRTQCD